MASPPRDHQNLTSALSPPYPSPSPLPHPPKRRQTDMPSSAPAGKRRKASMLSNASNSAHPLRQTSFPLERGSQTPGYSRSPSVDNMSVMSGVGSSKKRKRKSKGVGASEEGTGNGKPMEAKGKRRGSRDHTVDDEEDDGAEAMAVTTVARTQEERQKEVENRAMLVRALDPTQFQRYEAWRSSKLSDAVVRRIVNQTLSQSVPANVILAVKSVAKLFAGELIDGARKVQTEWIEATGESQTEKSPPPAPYGEQKEVEGRRGPLRPDHLRESIRRYKVEGDGGQAGQLGLWQLQAQNGVERFGTKVGGKRLFK